jgi:hypothetical protein
MLAERQLYCITPRAAKKLTMSTTAGGGRAAPPRPVTFVHRWLRLVQPDEGACGPGVGVASGASHWLKDQTPLYNSQSYVAYPPFTLVVVARRGLLLLEHVLPARLDGVEAAPRAVGGTS